MTSEENNCHTNSVELEEEERGHDSDYEDLPPLNSSGDVDTTDIGNANNISIQRIPYTRIYEPPLAFSDPKQRCLLHNCPIKVTIMNAEHRTGTHILNPYLYTIEVEHWTYKWTIKRRHNHFQNLHQALRIFRASLSIPIPMKKFRDRRKSIGPQNRRPVPRFPKRPEAFILSEESLEERKKELEEYLQNCLKIPMYRNHHEMMTFLEISPLSFVNELGHKGKEFLVLKRAGGFRRATCFTRFENFVTDITGHWRKRWLVVKDSCILYIRPKDGKIRAVMLMDHGFNAKSGVSTLGVHHGIRISNMSRDLFLKCWTSRKASELAQYLMQTSETFAQDFTNHNRYDSFAPIRADTWSQWFVDGANHFEAVCEALEAAKQEIFIADWWLSPHIFMRRPVMDGDHWRLDKILERKAIQGVRVFILVYKEVELGISINSLFTKQWLMKLHPNIKVLRHPDPTRGHSLLWSHHEKLVIVDQSYAFVGGIDLCFGRWDTYEHRITDLGGIVFDSNDPNFKNHNICNSTSPTGLRLKSNSLSQLMVRSNSLEEVNDSIKSELYHSKSSDNIVKFDLNFEDNTQEVSEETKVLENLDFVLNNNNNFDFESVSPNVESKFTEIPLDDNKDSVVDGNDNQEVQSNPTFKLRLASRLRTKRLQAVARFQQIRQMTRKYNDKGSECDLKDLEAKDESDFAITSLKSSELAINGLKGASKLWFGKDYVNFIVKDFVELNQPFKDFVDRNSTPRMPWHDLSCMVTGAAARDVARHFIERWNFTKFEKAKFNDTFPWLIPKSYSNMDLIKAPKFLLRGGPVSCQVVRSVCDWSIGIKRTDTSILSAYIDLINNAKHYVYIENQFFITQSKSPPLDPSEVVINPIGEALYHRIIRAFRDGQTFRVFIIFPLLPAFEGEIGTSRGVAIQAITHYNYATICRGNNSLVSRLRREVGDPFQYISFYGLRNHSELHGKLVSELVYVHSKLLLIDDNKAVIGSCNINDRSMLGIRDSEVAVVLADQEFESSIMDGQPFQSGKFCGSLRRTLFREHLGLFDNKNKTQEIDIRDPISDKFYKEVWMSTAAKNSALYERVFTIMPNDEVKTFAQLRDYLNRPKLVNTDLIEAKKCLSKIRGHLVLTPLHFLENEELTPAWGTGEKLMPSSLWT